MQIIYNTNKIHLYKFEENRNYEAVFDDFLRNTLLVLDFLYDNDIMTLTYKRKNDTKITLDIIDMLLYKAKEPIRIVKGNSNKYYPASNTVQFKDTHGVQFRKDYKKHFSGSNIGYNSPMALLAHELIHCYHELFDENGYRARRLDHSSKGKKISQQGRDLSFPNQEEVLVIRLANQVAKRLGEDKRGNYGRNYYPTESVLGIKKKKNIDV